MAAVDTYYDGSGTPANPSTLSILAQQWCVCNALEAYAVHKPGKKLMGFDAIWAICNKLIAQAISGVQNVLSCQSVL